MDLYLSFDADLNKVWGSDSDQHFKSPRERISIGEAIVAGTSREQDLDDDIKPPSIN